MENPNPSVAVIIMAAGLGTRMKSESAKVLQTLAGRPMIHYVIQTARQILNSDIILVVGHHADRVKGVVSQMMDVTYAFQERQLGTAHAVKSAVPYIPDQTEVVIILSGDVPLLTPQTLFRLLSDHGTANRDATVLGVEMENPTGYGRIVQDRRGGVVKIVEEADASIEQRQIRIINTGIYCIKKECLVEALTRVSPNNVQNEYYLTDIVEIGNRLGKTIGVYFCEDADEVMGINTLAELELAEALMGKRRCKTS